MDESFQLRARGLPGRRQAAALDFSMLTATLAAQRAAGPPAVPGAAEPGAPLTDPLTEIVLAGPDWKRAATAQCGCFNRAEVKRRRKTP